MYCYSKGPFTTDSGNKISSINSLSTIESNVSGDHPAEILNSPAADVESEQDMDVTLNLITGKSSENDDLVSLSIFH